MELLDCLVGYMVFICVQANWSYIAVDEFHQWVNLCFNFRNPEPEESGVMNSGNFLI